MDRATELQLLDELVQLKTAKSAFLDPEVTTSAVERYFSAEVFAHEQQRILRPLPQIAAHAGELEQANAFLAREIAGLPVLLTRDGEGQVHAFLNVCRHRGTRLVSESAGCKRLFTCPYHAWAWDNRGTLRGMPHGEQGFPGLDKTALGLKRLSCQERYGWIWLQASPGSDVDLDGFLDGLAPDLERLDAAALKIAHADTQERQVNWKILIEGGIEAYHFCIAHRKTIGPHFQDNLSSYRMFGPHIRSVLPRASLVEMSGQPKEDWSARIHANVLYTVFPTSQLLVMQDHVAWVQLEPKAADRTLIRLCTLVPSTSDLAQDDEATHWRTNHTITTSTLAEDFEIGESIQSGLASGANEHLLFGRFEGALGKFNDAVDGYLAQAG